jgi:LacI family transcriptional regulator
MAGTIKDVAEAAGCSIKTVSRVVNNEAHVSPEVRARVQAVVVRLGYVPNISARRLVQRHAYVICFLLHEGGLVQSAMISKLLETAYEYNYDILPLTYFPSLIKSRSKLASLIGERRIDGLVTTPPADTDEFLLDLAAKACLPMVQITPFYQSNNISYVTGDDYQGARQMTEYLIGLGHRRILFLSGPRNHRASLDRLYGYRAAVEGSQNGYDPRLVLDSEFNFDGGYTGAKLAMMTGLAPTAIFAGADEAAWGALYAVQEMGYRVPQEISVCGFGDLVQSQYIWPGLTSVHQPIDKIVDRAIQMLVEILTHAEQGERQVLLPSQIVVRASTSGCPDL